MNDIYKSIIDYYNTNFSYETKPTIYRRYAPESATFPYISMFIVSNRTDDCLDTNNDVINFQFNIFDNAISPERINDIYKEFIRIFDYANITFTDHTGVYCKRILTLDDKVDDVWQFNIQYEFWLNND